MSETRQWAERFEALRDDLATGDLHRVQKWVQNDGELAVIAEGIDRLTRELEAARELWGRIVEVLVRSACHDLTARDALDAVIRALATDTEGGEAEPPAHPVRMAQPDEEMAL